ncbi:ThiJ/PfpI family protein [[Actinomadura] parvosata subsp. kistnae]|uniref:Glutamine amidotransferase n=1 Tax=[Actinomadura] parvosata subsp. kistnae TaxID=1909395 RepID=A0A1V0ACX7_9ACTN|nr:type 1 glutamine amidotransferase family protein [Nonomuraea sp. ATCC 55076]AQZ68080.1 glutamine amidotransferase [Nonomuraea sp. ATCC 55076]SPL93539.1 ThiJ/PfpI family protein [Actinomadura parvosata subsp. kistnae]
MKKIAHHAVYDTLADWETGHLTSHLRNGHYQREAGGFEIVTVGLTTDPVVTMGGLRITPDIALADLSPADSALLILPGADLWDAGDALAPFAGKAREFLDAGVPVAAICGATAGLAREGLLDDRDHTGAAPQYLEAQEGYAGAKRYLDRDAVLDGDLVTAGPTEPVAFAREVFRRLDIYRPEVLDAWFRLFARSDASAFEVLMTA